MKGQSSKFDFATSRGRSKRSVLVVPDGDVNKILKFPRGKNLSVILHCTCSKNRTSFTVPAQPLTYHDDDDDVEVWKERQILIDDWIFDIN